jgi:citrate synthase
MFLLAVYLFPLDLVGSTLADPYISYSAALYALAGPLHG